MDKSERLAAAKQLLLHSGNIASWSKLRKKGALKTTEEVSAERDTERESLERRSWHAGYNLIPNVFVYHRLASFCWRGCGKELDGKRSGESTIKRTLKFWHRPPGSAQCVTHTRTQATLSCRAVVAYPSPLCVYYIRTYL